MRPVLPCNRRKSRSLFADMVILKLTRLAGRLAKTFVRPCTRFTLALPLPGPHDIFAGQPDAAQGSRTWLWWS